MWKWWWNYTKHHFIGRLSASSPAKTIKCAIAFGPLYFIRWPHHTLHQMDRCKMHSYVVFCGRRGGGNGGRCFSLFVAHIHSDFILFNLFFFALHSSWWRHDGCCLFFTTYHKIVIIGVNECYAMLSYRSYVYTTTICVYWCANMLKLAIGSINDFHICSSCILMMIQTALNMFKYVYNNENESSSSSSIARKKTIWRLVRINLQCVCSCCLTPAKRLCAIRLFVHLFALISVFIDFNLFLQILARLFFFNAVAVLDVFSTRNHIYFKLFFFLTWARSKKFTFSWPSIKWSDWTNVLFNCLKCIKSIEFHLAILSYIQFNSVFHFASLAHTCIYMNMCFNKDISQKSYIDLH